MQGIGYFALSVTLLVVSCGHAAQNPKDISPTDTLAPVNGSIPAMTGPELEHYSTITTRFFDSMLAGRFNGSILVAKKGVIIYERYKGFRNPASRERTL